MGAGMQVVRMCVTSAMHRGGGQPVGRVLLTHPALLPTLLPTFTALMLVVMTFNVGIILAVCGGFAIGALLFGHAGEPGTLQKRGTAKRPVLTAAQTMAPGPLSANAVAPEAEELETVFVEGAGCCSGGGSGYGGGGHGGGQL